MDELGPDEQRWVDVLRAADAPDEADRARVRAALLASLGTAGAITATGAVKAAAIANAGGAAKIATGLASWKIGVAVVALGIAGAGATLAMRASSPAVTASPGATGQSVASGPAPVTVVESPPPPSAAPAAEAVPPATASATVTRSASKAGASKTQPSARSPATDDVDAELALLARAQQALKQGDVDGALQALARHGREHPRGALAVEREGLRAVANCEGKRPGGKALATRFIAANPGSPLVARVHAACLSTDP